MLFHALKHLWWRITLAPHRHGSTFPLRRVDGDAIYLARECPTCKGVFDLTAM